MPFLSFLISTSITSVLFSFCIEKIEDQSVHILLRISSKEDFNECISKTITFKIDNLLNSIKIDKVP